MFEATAIASAFLVLITFGTASMKFFQVSNIEVESPVVLWEEIFPPVRTDKTFYK